MSQTPVITAIDLGTDKCATLIASYDEETRLVRVLGVSVVPARGMRRSNIIDLEQVLETMTESLDAAERMAGLEVKSAYVSVSGTYVSSQNSKGVVAVASPTQEITHEDIDRVIEAARALSLPSDREIIHVIPRDFKVDSQEGIKDPVGMTGVRLEAEVHIVTGLSTALKNLEKCVLDLGLQVDGFVFSGLASSEVVVSETEKELGVAVIDIGAGSTSLCVYVDGSLTLSAALPIGARHLTQDIALGCRVSLDAAEKIKTYLSSQPPEGVTPRSGESKEELNKRRKKADVLDVSKLGIEESVETLSKRTLFEGIMVPRMKEIFELVGKQLDNQGLLELIPAGVVITGGGAETLGITEVAKRVLQLPARIGKPVELQGLVSDIQKPSFATAIGLVHYGRKQGGTVPKRSGFSFSSALQKVNLGKLGESLSRIFKSIMP